MTHDLLCQLFNFLFLLHSYKQKNNQNTIYKTFCITHNTLILLFASLFQNNPAFWPIQNKTILTTSGFHEALAKIFHLITHLPPQHIFPIPYWFPNHSDHVSSPPIGHQDT